MNDKYLYLTSKHLTGEIAVAEQEELSAWINESEVNKAAFEEMQELWTLSADIEEDFDTDVSAAWEKVAKRTITKEAKIIHYPWNKQLLRIAAVIFVVIGGYWLLDNWNQKPEDIIAADTKFIDEIGLKEHLSPTRANGLVSMIKQLKMYALAYQVQLNK